MSDKQPYAALLDRLRPLWVFLTGGAFVTLAGGALTYMYFWNIGGIPIGQTGTAGSIIKVVVSSAVLLGGMLFMAWLAPTAIFQMFADETLFQERISPWFFEHQANSATGDKPLVKLGPVAVYAGSTVGLGCLGLTLAMCLIVLEVAHDWSWFGWSAYLGVIAALISWALWSIWKKVNQRDTCSDSAESSAVVFSKSKLGLVTWMYWGYSSAAVSLLPLFTLLLVFLKTDFLLRINSIAYLAFGMFVISMGVLITYSVSLAVLINRKKGLVVPWLVVLAINGVVLAAIVIFLGMSSRMLEEVMKLSSLRVENAVMQLEPEGCEILQSMQATGWEWTEGASKKTCVLYDVTIQSTLAPAMQVACWRGVLALEPTPQLPNAEQDTESATRNVQVAGRQGAFTIPTHYVRSIWKTAGLKPKEQAFVCPPTLSLQSRLTPTASE